MTLQIFYRDTFCSEWRKDFLLKKAPQRGCNSRDCIYNEIALCNIENRAAVAWAHFKQLHHYRAFSFGKPVDDRVPSKNRAAEVACTVNAPIFRRYVDVPPALNLRHAANEFI